MGKNPIIEGTGHGQAISMSFIKPVLGASINYIVSGGGEGGQKSPILLSKKTTKRGRGGQKSPILRQHSLWTAPYYVIKWTLKFKLANFKGLSNKSVLD